MICYGTLEYGVVDSLESLQDEITKYPGDAPEQSPVHRTQYRHTGTECESLS